MGSTALNNLGRRAHVIPDATDNSMDLTSKYVLPRWLSVKRSYLFECLPSLGSLDGRENRHDRH